MDIKYDYRRFAILYVDDLEPHLRLFTSAFGGTFRILTANSANAGFELLQQHREEIGVLITDQRMPLEKGTQLLEKARALAPRIVRMLVTAFTDLADAVQAVNTGAIYKYIEKPWEPRHLEMNLKRALEFFIVQRERDLLLREKLSVLQNLMITDRVISLGLVAADLGHYVQNSLVAVRTFLDLFPAKVEEAGLGLEDLRDPTFWRDFYGQVQSQVRRITGMLQALGEATERPQPRFDATVQVGQLLREALARHAARLQEKGLTVQDAVPADLPALKVDSNLFGKFWDFLLSDEIVSLPAGSEIKVMARTTELPPGGVPGLLFEVQDNGPGLPEQDVRSVFNPFVLRGGDPKEFGISLMACYFIIYHHGGRVEVSTDPGQGVRFRFYLPLDPSTLQTPRATEQEFLSKLLMNERLWDKLLSTP